MDQAEVERRRKLAAKLMKLRRLELRGSTDGEKAAARAAFERVASKEAFPVEQIRSEIDELIAREEAPRQRPAPGPHRHCVVIIVGGSFGSATGGATTGWEWTWG